MTMNEMKTPKQEGARAPSIHERWAAVQAEVRQMDKDKRVSGGGPKYDYFSEAQVKAFLRTVFRKHGLFIMPSFHGVTTEKIEKPGNKVEFFQTVHGQVTIYSDAGDKIGPFSIAGSGMDSREKAIFKAETAGLRHWFLNALCISDGMDPEEYDDPAVTAATAPAPAPVDPVITITGPKLVILDDMRKNDAFMEVTIELPNGEMKSVRELMENVDTWTDAKVDRFFKKFVDLGFKP